MNAQLAEVIVLIAIVNAAAVVIMVPLSFLVSSWALDALEQFDLWMRQKQEKPRASSQLAGRT